MKKIIIIIIFCIGMPVYPIEKDGVKDTIDLVEEEYIENKKNDQTDQFKDGQWTNEEKVETWFNEDAEYLKLSIILKKKYVSWAKKQKELGKIVDPEKFITTHNKNLNTNEKEIIKTIHQNTFVSKEKIAEKANNEKINIIKPIHIKNINIKSFRLSLIESPAPEKENLTESRETSYKKYIIILFIFLFLLILFLIQKKKKYIEI